MKLRCWFGFHGAVRRFRIGERICTDCGACWQIGEVVVNNMRTGRWYYMGRLSNAEIAKIAEDHS